MNNPPNNAPTWPQPPVQWTPPKVAGGTGAPERMPTAEARRRAGVLKRWALAGTTLAFCALSGLAASHVTGVTSAAAGSSGASATTTPSNQDDNGSFFPTTGQGSDNGQHSGQGGGFNFGSGGVGTFQPPASSSGGS